MKKKQFNQLRIIGGTLRGRKINFPALPGLRPTPDRVRETLFNWLMPVIQDATCLDLFAGSGALGLEALSRGARQVFFVDHEPQIIAHLHQQINHFKINNAAVITANFTPDLDLNLPLCDIVFLDPPFQQGLIKPCCDYLAKSKILSDKALIYLETEAHLKPLPILEQWKIIKHKTAGQVGYYLVQPFL